MRITLSLILLLSASLGSVLGAAFPLFSSRKPGGVAGPTPLLLNSYSGAVAAYSVRKLDTNYAGSCVRIRRSSDNTEQDVGFSSDYIDTASAESFCSATDGFVVKWYDQSGNANDAVNSTNSRQPQIVSSGAMLTDGGKVRLQFTPDGTSKMLPLTSAITGAVSWTVESVFVRASSAHNLCPLVTLNAYVSPFLGTSVGNDMYVDSSAAYSLFTVTELKAVMMSIALSGDQDIFINNSEITATVSNSTHSPGTNFEAIGSNGASFSTTGSYHEIVIWSSDKSSSVSGISGNVNTYYSIY